jgi:hypothetical protein
VGLPSLVWLYALAVGGALIVLALIRVRGCEGAKVAGWPEP